MSLTKHWQIEFSNIYIIYQEQVKFILLRWGIPLTQMQAWFKIWKSVNVIHLINKLKGENYTILPTDTENAFDNNSFVIKPLREIEIKGNVLNLTKIIYKKLTASNKARMSILTTLTQHCAGSPSQRSKETKSIHIRKEEIKPSLL